MSITKIQWQHETPRTLKKVVVIDKDVFQWQHETPKTAALNIISEGR
jgi:hypothetical protein